MKFRSFKQLLKKAAVIGMITFAVPVAFSACSFWFEGNTPEQGVREFTDRVGTFIKDNVPTLENADEFGEIIRKTADDFALENDTEFVKAKVVRVVDGDTLVVEINNEETKVRLIGVDTPESVASEEYLERTGKENTEEGVNASDFTKSILAQHPYIYLEKDQEESDKYGRSLYYVWLEKPTGLSNDIRITDIETKMLNGILLKEGIAKTAVFKPNIKYADEFAAIEAGLTDEYEIDR